jgi:hypothetical protein
MRNNRPAFGVMSSLCLRPAREYASQTGHLLAAGSAPDPSAPLSVRVVQLPSPAAFHVWLRVNVYGARDASRKRAREGQQLRGGELLSVDEFDGVTKGDGFALYVKN